MLLFHIRLSLRLQQINTDFVRYGLHPGICSDKLVGDISILIEYGEFVFAALFVKGSSAEARSQLKSFVKRFEAKHLGVLPDWSGTLAPFGEDNLLVEEIFKEE